MNSKSLSFTTKNIKHLQRIQQVILEEWQHRSLSKRIQSMDNNTLQRNGSSLPRQTFSYVGTVGRRDRTSLFKRYNAYHQNATINGLHLAWAGAIKRYWRVRFHRTYSGQSSTSILARIDRYLHIPDDNENDVTTLQQRYDSATKQFASMIK